jgi:hypothetical protein
LLGEDRQISDYTTAVAPPTDTKATIPREKESTIIMGRGVFFAVRADVLYSG